MSTEYARTATDTEREALARRVAKLRQSGIPWDGTGGIVDSLRLVSSATQGRALLRKFKFDAKSGGPVEIRDSYDRFELNPSTGQRKGYRRLKAPNVSSREVPERPAESVATAAAASERQPSSRPGVVGDASRGSISGLVCRIRQERIAAVPDIDPHGPGADANFLVVLRDPGRLGALTTCYLSALNPDRTAANLRRLFAAASLPLGDCLFWNAVPWDLDGRNPRSSDLDGGAVYLAELVGLMTRPPIMVACGNHAHDTCARAGLSATEVCHPSDRGLHGGGVNREPAFIAGLKKAARTAKGRTGSTP